MRYRANPVIVDAEVITEVGERQPNGWLPIKIGNGVSFKCDPGMVARMTPLVGDYLVKQEDGYVYLNPKAVFERKYSPDELNAAELGAAVRRANMARS